MKRAPLAQARCTRHIKAYSPKPHGAIPTSLPPAISDSADGVPRFSDAAIREWNGHVEAMLRGLAHALNNRAAALSAVLELSRAPDEDTTTEGMLDAELIRMADLAAVVRHMGQPRATTEAFSPEDAAQHAAAVLRLHADVADWSTVIDARGAPPIRAQRWMFVRALVTLGACATGSPGTTITIRLTGAGDWLEARVSDASAAIDASLYLAELSRGMGGERIAGHGFRVPTLAALRRREGR